MATVRQGLGTASPSAEPCQHSEFRDEIDGQEVVVAVVRCQRKNGETVNAFAFRPGDNGDEPPRDWRERIELRDVPCLLRAPELRKAPRDLRIFYAPSVAVAADVGGAGLIATADAEGDLGDDVPAEILEPLRGASICLLCNPGNPRPRLRQQLARIAGSLRAIEAPEAGNHADFSAWLERQAGETKRAFLLSEAEAAPELRAASLEDVVAVVLKRLRLSDPAPIYLLLATYVANVLAGDPVWLLVIAGPSSGKTELLYLLTGLPHTHSAATLTEAGLLSGSPKRDHSKDATGGLLRQVGEFGIILLKDFGSVLSMDKRSSRPPTLAALREMYDGSWTRVLGTDGGKSYAWEGKAGLVACGTGAIDNAWAAMSVLGDRFMFYRLPVEDRQETARFAIQNRADAQRIRQNIAAVSRDFMANLDIPDDLPALDQETADRIVRLADVVTLARSPIPRDSYTRQIEEDPGDPEGPARLANALAQLLSGFDVLGVTREVAWPIVEKVGLDCIAAIRRNVLEVLLAADEPQTTLAVAKALARPKRLIDRTLKDLFILRLVSYHSEQIRGVEADLWTPTEKTRECYPDASPGCKTGAWWRGKDEIHE